MNIVSISSRFALALGGLLPCLSFATVAYSLKPDVAKEEFVVSVRIDHPNTTETFEIPGWSPGYYMMEQYEAKISDVKSVDEDGKVLALTKTGARSWQVGSHPDHAMILTYKVAGSDVGLGFFGASVKANEAYTNGPASFMYVIGRQKEDVSVHVEHPASWKVATPLTPVDADTFTAGGYDEMADDPIQIGPYVERKFEVKGIPFRAIFVAPPREPERLDPDKTAAMLKLVSTPAIELFHGAPFKQYTYFFHLTGLGFQGGLEHHAGTVIAIPNSNQNDLSDLCSHEYFHAWNVKQIRPSILGPFDYTKPQRTGNLWFAEGVTDYYSKILTYRSTVHDLGWLMGELSDQINTYQAGRTRLKNTVEDESRAAWEHGGFSFGDLDFYNKGLIAGLIFDAKIREVTRGTRSLDDVMRLMYGKYRLPNPGYPEDGIKEAINQVAGTDLSKMYDSLIRSSDELPYDVLESIGLKLVRPNTSSKIAVGFPTPNENVEPDELDRFGLKKSDRFMGFAASTGDGSSIAMFLRAGTTKTVTLPLTSKDFTTFELIVNPSPGPAQADRFKEWTTE